MYSGQLSPYPQQDGKLVLGWLRDVVVARWSRST